MTEFDVSALVERLEGLEVGFETDRPGPPRLTVDSDRCLDLLGRLRDDPDLPMRRLVDLTAIDRGRARGFEVVYRLHSPAANRRVEVWVAVEDVDSNAVDPDQARPTLDSVVSLWPGANWLEREVFDLFGIRFRGHPDLRRILLPADFEGAPLRKDYPRQPNLPLHKEIES